MANKQVNVILSLTDRMSAPLVKVADNMKNISAETKKGMADLNRGSRKFEKSMDGLVKKSFKWAKRIGILAGGAAFTLGVKGTGDLQDGANKVKSIAREALELKEIQEGLLKVSTKLGGGIKTTDVADAQYQAISSGIDPKDSLAFTELAGKLRVAGFTDIESAINLLTSTMNAFNLDKLEDAKKLADEFLYTQNKGVILVDEMSQYYGQLMPFFSTMKLGTEDMNIAIATLTKMGVKPAEAVTSTKALMKDLSGATPKAIKEAAAYGVELSAAALESRGFAGTMNEIIEATGGDVDKIMGIFPNVRSMIASLNLTSEKGVEIFKDVAMGMGDSVGLVDEAYETMQNSLPYRLKSIRGALQNAWTKILSSDKIATPIMDKLKEVDEFLRSEEGWEYIGEKVELISQKMIDIYNVGKRIVKGIASQKENIASIGKAVLVLYGAIKAVRVVASIAQKFITIKEVIMGLAGKGLALGITVEFVAIIMAVVKALQYFRENWDSLSDRYPQTMAIINWFVEKLKMLGGWIVDNGGVITTVIGTILKSIGAVFEFIVGTVIERTLGKIEGVITIIQGAKTTILGILKLLKGMMLIDTELMMEGVKEIFSGGVDIIEGIWQKFISFFTAPVEPVLNLLEKVFGEKVDWMREKWEKFRNFITKPISTTVNFVKDKLGWGEDDSTNSGTYKVPAKATGDRNWKGGIVQVSEKGGEILDLPNGTRIYPHDDSVGQAFIDGARVANTENNQKQTFNLPSINIYGNVYGEKDLMDKVGNELVATLEKYLPNMA